MLCVVARLVRHYSEARDGDGHASLARRSPPHPRTLLEQLRAESSRRHVSSSSALSLSILDPRSSSCSLQQKAALCDAIPVASGTERPGDLTARQARGVASARRPWPAVRCGAVRCGTVPSRAEPRASSAAQRSPAQPSAAQRSPAQPRPRIQHDGVPRSSSCGLIITPARRRATLTGRNVGATTLCYVTARQNSRENNNALPSQICTALFRLKMIFLLWTSAGPIRNVEINEKIE